MSFVNRQSAFDCIREEEITYADHYREKKKAKNGAFAIAASIDEYTKTFTPKSTSSSSSLHNVRNGITKKIESLKDRSDYLRNLTGRETFKLKLQVSKPENLEWFLAFDGEECEGFAEEFLRRDI